METLVEAANARESIVLVSGDNAAFSPSRGTGLASELQDELEARGLPREAIRRIRIISDFTSTLPSVPELQLRIDDELAAHPELARRLGDALTEQVMGYEEGSPWVPGLPLDVDLLRLSWVDDISNVEITGARQLDGGTAAVEMTAEVDASLDLYVWKYDAYPYEGDDFRITDPDYNESFAEGYVHRRVFVEFEAIFEPDEQSFSDLGVVDLTILDP